MAKKQSKKTGVVRNVIDNELQKAKLYKLGEPSLGQQILNTVSSIHAPVIDLDINNEFEKIGISASNLANEYLDLVSYSSPFKDILKEYDNTVNKLLGLIVTYEQNPVLKQLREVEIFYKDFNKSKEKVENELYHQLTESDLQDIKNENKVLQNQLKKALKTIKKQKQLVDLDYAVLKDKKTITTNSKAPKTLTLKPNFDNFKEQTKTIYKETKTLFTSTLEQWQNLFSDSIKPFDNSIELKSKTTLEDLRFLMAELIRVGLLNKLQYGSILEKSKAFKFGSKIVTSRSLTDAHRKAKSGAKNSYIINNLITILKVDK